MTDFAARLVARALGTAPLIEPRAPLRFEPRADAFSEWTGSAAAPEAVVPGPSSGLDARTPAGIEAVAVSSDAPPIADAPPSRSAGPRPMRDGSLRPAADDRVATSIPSRIPAPDRPFIKDEALVEGGRPHAAPEEDGASAPVSTSAPTRPGSRRDAFRDAPDDRLPPSQENPRPAPTTTAAPVPELSIGTGSAKPPAARVSGIAPVVDEPHVGDARAAASRPLAAADEPIETPDRTAPPLPAATPMQRREGIRPNENAPPAAPPATRRPDAPAEPLAPIIVEIGAIEFRAPAAVAAPIPAPRAPSLSLDAYMARRRGAS